MHKFIRTFKIRSTVYGQLLELVDVVVTTRHPNISSYLTTNGPGIVINPTEFEQLSLEEKSIRMKYCLLNVGLPNISLYRKAHYKGLFSLAVELTTWRNLESEPDYNSQGDFLTFSKLEEDFGIKLIKSGDSAATYARLTKIHEADHLALMKVFESYDFSRPMWENVYSSVTVEADTEEEDQTFAEEVMEFSHNSFLRNAVEVVQAKDYGKLPGAFTDLFLKLTPPKPPFVDWKKELKIFSSGVSNISKRMTRRKESRRMEGAPGTRSKRNAKIVVAIDTSGSIRAEELDAFYNELIGVHRSGASITVLECDAAIQNQYEFTGKPNHKPKGGGGTSFDPVIEFVNKASGDYDALVYFTDGCAPAPSNCLVPSFWLISEGNSLPKGLPGKVVEMKKKDE